MDTSQIVTLAIAVWGAGLATYEAIQRRRDRQLDIEVTHSIGIPPGAPDDLPRLMITALNRSSAPVTLVGSGLVHMPRLLSRLSWQSARRFWNVIPWIAPTPDPRLVMPYELSPGSKCSDMMNMRQITHDLLARGQRGKVRVRGFFIDGANRSFLTKPIEIDVEPWRPFGVLRPEFSRDDRPPPVQEGSIVLRPSGAPIGTVREVGGNSILVDRGPSRSAVRLPLDWVGVVETDRVRLMVLDQEIDAMVNGPVALPSDRIPSAEQSGAEPDSAAAVEAVEAPS